MHHLTTDRPLRFIAHNSADIVHYGEVAAGQNISTGQPELELFEIDQEEQFEARLVALGVVLEPVEPEETL